MRDVAEDFITQHIGWSQGRGEAVLGPLTEALESASGKARIAELEAALERIAALNDLSGFEDHCSAAYGRLAECEAIARAALERK